MSGLVERLRSGPDASVSVTEHLLKYQALCDDAAAKIARLTAEREQYIFHQLMDGPTAQHQALIWKMKAAALAEQLDAAESELTTLRANNLEARSGYAMIRENAPIGAMKSSEQVGPTFTDEAEAIVAGILKMVEAKQNG